MFAFVDSENFKKNSFFLTVYGHGGYIGIGFIGLIG